MRGLTTIDGGVAPARISVGDIDIAALPLPSRMCKVLASEGITRVSQLYAARYLPMVGDKTIAEASAVLVTAGYPPLKSRGSILCGNAEAWRSIFPPLHLVVGG